MTEALEVFWRDRHVGQFRRADKTIEFVYDEDAPETPISLSLPRHGRHNRLAAAKYLDNLLPDNRAVRDGWARRLKVPNTPFDLLGRMGEDVAGALVLVPEGSDPANEPCEASPASDDEIAERVASIIRNPSSWLSVEQLGRARMSLAGAQGKFTLARARGRWFWSDAATPSTHILKPAIHRLPQVPELEAAALALARRAGIPAPHAEATEFYGQRTYMVERFDRDERLGRTRRIHTEDFAQAKGRAPEQKYGSTAKQLLAILGEHAGEEDQYAFVRMFAYNTAIGNTDAHAKNYSVLLEDGVHLAPLYDSIPTRIWPEFTEDRQAMKIAGVQRAQGVQPGNWRKLGRTAGLDPDRVLAIAQEVGSVVLEQYEDVFRSFGVAPGLVGYAGELFRAATRNLLPEQAGPRPRRSARSRRARARLTGVSSPRGGTW